MFQSKKADFLIPDYQIPYAWGENECRTLWYDIFSSAIPDEGKTEFDSNSEYFLGPIVAFKNDNDKMEVIDGQQRLITLMLLLIAFYSKFAHMQDKDSVSTKQNNDKKKYYQGFANAKGQIKEGTGIVELLYLTTDSIDFTEMDILCRYNIMMDSFINYLKSNELL